MDKVLKIIDVLKPNAVTVFSKTYCPYCTEAKTILSRFKITSKIYECDTNPLTTDQASELFKLSGIKTFPNIFIGQQSIKGCSDMKTLISKGEFFNILDKWKISYQKLWKTLRSG